MRVTIPMRCKGRDAIGRDVLEEPVAAVVTISAMNESTTALLVTLDVTCIHITGGHDQRCRASYSEKDKVGSGVECPFSVDIPYALEKDRSITRRP